MVTPAAKREAVPHLVETYEMSERRACRLIRADRKTVRYRSRRPRDEELRHRLRELATEQRRFGYRRLHVLLRAEGHLVNRKKTQRLYREEGLTVRKRKGRKRAVGFRAPILIEVRPNARWSVAVIAWSTSAFTCGVKAWYPSSSATLPVGTPPDLGGVFALLRPNTGVSASRRARRLDARRARQTLAPCCGRQGHRLHDHALACFLADGRICLSNNAAERALRGLALGRKSWLFAGSERGAERVAIMYTLNRTAKLNDVDPQAWLADVLARIADTPQTRLIEFLPWNWHPELARQKAA
jgi:IS66 C-terminal element/Transposase IS66 family/HTH-like domain